MEDGMEDGIDVLCKYNMHNKSFPNIFIILLSFFKIPNMVFENRDSY